MKRIGLLGGMSWESTAVYYQLINQDIAERLGGLHSADLVMVSVDFAHIEQLQSQGRWEEAGNYLASQARALEGAGAEMIVLCTNTMHKVAPTTPPKPPSPCSPPPGSTPSQQLGSHSRATSSTDQTW